MSLLKTKTAVLKLSLLSVIENCLIHMLYCAPLSSSFICFFQTGLSKSLAAAGLFFFFFFSLERILSQIFPCTVNLEATESWLEEDSVQFQQNSEDVMLHIWSFLVIIRILNQTSKRKRTGIIIPSMFTVYYNQIHNIPSPWVFTA